jgi:hypothetical protein
VFGSRVVALVDGQTAAVEWEGEGKNEVKYHSNEVIAKMEREFLQKKYNNEDEDVAEEGEAGDNPMNL